MTLFLDLTRISTRLLRGGPTGIDRVEFAYGQHFVGNCQRQNTVSLLTTPFATGAVPAKKMGAHLARIERAWAREESRTSDAFYGRVREAIEAPADLSRLRSLRLKRHGRRQAMGKLLQFPLTDIVLAPSRFRRALRQTTGQRTVYYHASHTQLDKPERFQWLRRHDVRAVFFIHDTIPVDYPEFCSPGSAKRHDRRLRTVSDMASVLIVNSHATKASVRSYLEGQGWRVPEIEVVPLGVDKDFLPDQRSRLTPPAGNYFVVVGTIEPRKNLLFLFNLWRELAARRGAQTPRLVLVGRRGWENENILDVLERSKSLAPYILEVADLSDAGLAALMRGARGVLAPSRVEGFSLPVAEALSLGASVLASDIIVHREIVPEGAAKLLPTTDGSAWLAEIERLANPETTSEQPAAVAAKPMTWPGHAERVGEILDKVSAIDRLSSL